MNDIKDIQVIEEGELTNTFKLKSRAKYLVKVLSINGLVYVLSYFREENIKYFILGAGSNVVLDEYFDGAVIVLEGLNNVEVLGMEVKAQAGVMMGKVTKAAVDANLTGLEWAINIPGTIGGSVVGNAGAYNSDVFERLVKVKVLTQDLEVKEMAKEDFLYSYRHTNIKELGLIVLEATFRLDKGDKVESKRIIKDRCKRRCESQPLDMPSAGSVFRNPEEDFAARLIEEAGLKGTSIGGAQVSEKHANFIVNVGSATSNDIKNLIKLVKERVKEKFDVDLINEQEIIEWK